MNYEAVFQSLNQYLGFLSGHPYLYSGTIFVSFVAVAMGIIFSIEKILAAWAKGTETSADNLILKKIKGPVLWAVVLVGLRLSLFPLNIPEKTAMYLSRILSTLGFAVGVLVSIAIFDIIIDNWAIKWTGEKTKIDREVVRLFHRLSRIVIVAIGLVFILNTWGINVSPLLASLGVAGVAVAFGLQKTLGNLFGGISLIIDKAVKEGDMIELEGGEIGTVTEVGLRSTRIRTFDNEILIVPNGNLSESNIKNYTPPDPSARLSLPFSVAYGSTIEEVKETALKSIEGIEGIKEDPVPFVRFSEMADFALKFKLFLWIEDYKEKYSIKDEVNVKLYNTLIEAGISIPFPQMDVHMED